MLYTAVSLSTLHTVMDRLLQPRDRNVQLLRNDTLGSGSYGVVCKAMCGQRLCAAKLLHPIFFQCNDPGIVTTRRRFEQECCFLNDMKHTHIVEYLGTSHDPDSGLLVLLMELMDESLTHFLERSQQPLAYHIEVDLCHDIAQALAYIHSKEIIHRDLSSNNVLLLTGRAKITDFGMSKLLDANQHMTPLTMCPGTLVYMPPEALREPPVYSKKIDCFSFGVLQIQIMTCQFPDPGPPKQVIEDSRSPTGTIEMPVLDSKRRKSHIDLIDPNHTLLPTALDCLSYLEKDRPSAQDLCQQLAAFKEAPRYQLQTLQQELQTKDQRLQDSQRHLHTLQQELQTNDQQLQDSQRRMHTLQQELQTNDQQLQDSQRRMHTLQQELQTRDQQLQDSQRRMHTLQQEFETRDQQLQDSQRRMHTLQQEFETKDQDSQRRMHTLQQDSQRQIQQLTHQVEEKQHAIFDKETLLQELNQKLQSNEQVTAEFQQNLLQYEEANKHLQDTVGELRQGLRQAMEEIEAECRLRELNRQLQKMPQVGALPHETRQLQPMNRPGTLPHKTIMQQKVQDMKWQKETKAPEKMRRGSAASDSDVAYFNSHGSTTVHSYDSNTREWHRLPCTPHTHFTLVVVQHMLTLVGGLKSDEAINCLLSLMGEGRDKKWLPHFSAMPTKRYLTAAVCSGHSLIVAGGRDDHQELATVEVLDTDNRQWSIASSLTHPFTRATVSIGGERLYMLGGGDHTGETCSVLSCSVPELLQSCQPQPLAGKLRTAPANQSTIWQPVADAPHYWSSCATLCGQLVAVGGYKGGKDTNTITGYNKRTNSWEAMGDMPTARQLALVAILNGKMMVVGGWVSRRTATDVVEILR